MAVSNFETSVNVGAKNKQIQRLLMKHKNTLIKISLQDSEVSHLCVSVSLVIFKSNSR